MSRAGRRRPALLPQTSLSSALEKGAPLVNDGADPLSPASTRLKPRMDLFDIRLDQARDRYGYIVAAALVVAALAGLILSASMRSSRLLVLSLLAIGLGAVVLVPAAPRLARALQQFAFAGPPAEPSGPYSAATFNVLLPPAGGGGAPILARLWHPSDTAWPPPGAPLPCAQATAEHRLARGDERVPIVLYAPGNGNGRDENASTSATLASHGFIVLAIDDVERDSPEPSAPRAEPLSFDFSSDEAYEKTLKGGARKAEREARKALAALDRLAACASPDWRGRLDLDRVGFFGFSFGGAAAAEASVIDKRIAAVANLDGWLFGRALSGALEKPYMIMNSDAVLPSARALQSSNPGERNTAALTLADLREEVRLGSRPDGYWLWVKGARHESFTDQIFDRRFAASWVALDPARAKTIREAYLLAFFETYLRGKPSPLLRQAPSPYAEVELLGDSGPRLKGSLSASGK